MFNFQILAYWILLIIAVALTTPKSYSQDLGIYPGTINVTPSNLIPTDDIESIPYISSHQTYQQHESAALIEIQDIISQGLSEDPPKYFSGFVDSSFDSTQEYEEFCGFDISSSLYCSRIVIKQLNCPTDWVQWTAGHASFCVPDASATPLFDGTLSPSSCPAGYTSNGSPYQCFPDITSTQCDTFAAEVAAINHAYLVFPSGATYCEVYYDLDQDENAEFPTANLDAGTIQVDIGNLEDLLGGDASASNSCDVEPVCNNDSAQCAILLQTWYSMCSVQTVDTSGTGSSGSSGGGGTTITPVEYGDPLWQCDIYDGVTECYLSDSSLEGLIGSANDPFANDPNCTAVPVDQEVTCDYEVTYCDVNAEEEYGECGSQNCEWSDAIDGSCEDIVTSGGGDTGSGGDGSASGEVTIDTEGRAFNEPVPTSWDDFQTQVDDQLTLVEAELQQVLDDIGLEINTVFDFNIQGAGTITPNIHNIKGADVDFSLYPWLAELSFLPNLIFLLASVISFLIIVGARRG